jgi:hypothetical protein
MATVQQSPSAAAAAAAGGSSSSAGAGSTQSTGVDEHEALIAEQETVLQLMRVVKASNAPKEAKDRWMMQLLNK